MDFINNSIEAVGNTPLLKLNKIGKGVEANVYVKLEHLNPSGSYKDRIALAMVEAAERGDTWNNKKLKPGGTVCDVSAGNFAPALAFVCAVKGYKGKIGIYTPMLKGDGVRIKITSAFGADVTECKHPSNFLTEKELEEYLNEDEDLTFIVAGKKEMYELEKSNPEVIWLDQIYNKNAYRGQMNMGYEIFEQLEGKVDAFGCAVGSGATFFGVASALKEKGLDPYTFGVVPGRSEKYLDLDKPEAEKGEFRLSKLKGKLVQSMGLDKWKTEKSIVEEILDNGYPNKFFRVSSEDARNMANRLCSEEGIYCGMSSGANVHIALKVAKTLKKGQNVVTPIVDRRDRYLGEYPNDIFIV